MLAIDLVRWTIPISAFAFSTIFSCRVCRIKLSTAVPFLLVNALVSLLCLSPLLSIPVLGMTVGPTNYSILMEEDYTLRYFFITPKLDWYAEHHPYYISGCISLLVALIVLEILAGTWITKRILDICPARPLTFLSINLIVGSILTIIVVRTFVFFGWW